MQFGFFDDDNKEYVITRPDTPRSWTNYLGSTEYGAIITNNAGGYSFYQSAAQGRFTRLRFNNIPMDQPGRYLYLRDQDSSDYWSASWQPVGKPLEQYKTECRHGTAYTTIRSEYAQIETITNYFVPLGKTFECWWCKVRNNSNKQRRLRLFTYVEYTNNWNVNQDFLNLQYSQYILNMSVVDNIIDHGTNVNMPAKPEDFQDNGQGRHTFLAVSGADVTGYDTDRDVFLGGYRDYSNPVVVEQGQCKNSLAVGDNGCGVLQIDIVLQAGESRDITVLMGIGTAGVEGKAAVKEFSNINDIKQALSSVKQHWQNRICNLSAQTPDAEFNSLFNVWTPYNCLITYAWSRAASLIYTGERDGLGYRDTVQDMLGCLPSIPTEVIDRLELMITGQASTGGAMPVVKPFAHCPGKEPLPGESEYRSDDCLWLFNTVPAYVKETGDLDFFDKILPYADKGEDTVLAHLRRAIEFNLERSGAHGLPCGLLADWNDCLELGHEGETVFVAFQLRYALKIYTDICRIKNLPAEITWAEQQLNQLDNNIDKHAWDGEWYLRAFRYDGFKFGSKESEEASIFLNPQSWAVFSGHADHANAEQVMQSVNQRLATEHGLMICDPPVTKMDPQVIRARLFNPGMKENAAIFCHTQGWAIIAEAMLGHGDRAWQYFRSYMPSAYNSRAEVREIEPYVYCQSTHSKYSPRFGASRVPWLSGAATWAYYSASQYILGIQPEYNGLRIEPCIPASWSGFKVERNFRGKQFIIEVRNRSSVQKGVKTLSLNGEILKENFIPIDQAKKENTVIVEMG
ncbi:MAG: N,N'-diacetylchitobiose phosphorylase [Gammaproteobacteria bacterium]|nr:N,N'-diacetylchitobiose phosphorylase [Gammaproteobacteria bacterium]